MGHNQMLSRTNAKYPFTRTDIKMLTIGAGQTNDCGMQLSRDDIAGGFALYAFNLEPNFPQGGNLTLLKQAICRLDVTFDSSLSEPINCIIYAEFPGYFEVNQKKNNNFGKLDTFEKEYVMTLPDSKTYFDVNSDSKFTGVTMEEIHSYLSLFEKPFDSHIYQLYSEEFRNSDIYQDYFRNTCLNFNGISKLPIFQTFEPANTYALAHDHDYLRLSTEDIFLNSKSVGAATSEQVSSIEKTNQRTGKQLPFGKRKDARD
ncbi:hypothetical protein KUTeg_021479 [Tegillarca granosa]|uniref:Uncharacterized protein n=1 Tax=Tegillarca granosa TaxID=220873 RepID=A0ABQ9E497_TEGGR|nr:hypothetical protein KUTeg_021479 [Tegillarca granosa]